ncbi:MAG: hypothetical protein ACPG77_08820, partial [Nannocystaceae bacterium]
MLAAQDLDGNATTKFGVDALVDFAHGPLTKESFDRKVPDRLRDRHRPEAITDTRITGIEST